MVKHPAMVRLFGHGREISVWRWDPDQIIPPVAAQIAGSPAMQAESAHISFFFLTLWVVIEETC